MNEKILQLAKRGRDDLFFLAKHILNYSRMVEKPHKELCGFLKNSNKKVKLILMPRGSFKSSVVTIAYAIQSIIRNPNVRIILSSETQSNALKFLAEIKAHLEGNEKFKAIYGDWVRRNHIWRTNEIVVAGRNIPRKEGTIICSSLEKGHLTGLHAECVILDDVVSGNNTGNQDQINKTIDHYKLLLSILEPKGEIVIVGTHWSHYNLYSWLLDPDGPEFDQVDYFHRSAEDDFGNPTMPEILSREYLDQQKKTQGTFIYSCQYLNKPNVSDLAFFKADNIQYYKKAPEHLNYFMSVDPAISLKARSDFTGLIVVGVDYWGNWYVLEALAIKVEPSDLIEKIFEMARKYSPLMCMCMEKFALEKVLKHNLIQTMNDREFFIPIKDVETNTRISKEARIRALQPLIEQKKLYLRKEQNDLFTQIIKFPHLKNDDLIDSLKNLLKIVFPSDVKPKDPGVILDKISQHAMDELENFTKKKVRVTYLEDF